MHLCRIEELQIVGICLIGWADRVTRAARQVISFQPLPKELILREATTVDATCVMLEAVFVLVVVDAKPLRSSMRVAT